jgi:hypothetical protein
VVSHFSQKKLGKINSENNTRKSKDIFKMKEGKRGQLLFLFSNFFIVEVLIHGGSSDSYDVFSDCFFFDPSNYFLHFLIFPVSWKILHEIYL